MKTNNKNTVIRSERIILPSKVDFTEQCSVWRAVYNTANYIQRNLFENKLPLLKSTLLTREVEKHKDYPRWKDTIGKGIHRVIVNLRHDWNAYFAAMKEYSRDTKKFLSKPNPPGWTGSVFHGHRLATVKFQKEQIRTPSNPARPGKGLKKDELQLPKLYNNLIVKRHISLGKEVVSAELKPIGIKRFELVINYQEVKPQVLPSSRIAAIDLGMKYAVTMVDNLGSVPVYRKGGYIESINQWFNKQMAKLQPMYAKTGNNHQNGKTVERIRLNREKKLRDVLHKLAKDVVQWCVDRQIDTIVIGLNPLWKQRVNNGKRFNQNFCYFPFRRIIDKITEKAELQGIRVEVEEEDHTSKCSFLDNESIEHHDSYLGKRGPRGLFTSANGTYSDVRVHQSSYIHSDVNAAYNIGKKVFPNIFDPNKIRVIRFPTPL